MHSIQLYGLSSAHGMVFPPQLAGVSGPQGPLCPQHPALLMVISGALQHDRFGACNRESWSSPYPPLQAQPGVGRGAGLGFSLQCCP